MYIDEVRRKPLMETVERIKGFVKDQTPSLPSQDKNLLIQTIEEGMIGRLEHHELRPQDTMTDIDAVETFFGWTIVATISMCREEGNQIRSHERGINFFVANCLKIPYFIDRRTNNGIHHIIWVQENLERTVDKEGWKDFHILIRKNAERNPSYDKTPRVCPISRNEIMSWFRINV